MSIIFSVVILHCPPSYHIHYCVKGNLDYGRCVTSVSVNYDLELLSLGPTNHSSFNFFKPSIIIFASVSSFFCFVFRESCFCSCVIHRWLIMLVFLMSACFLRWKESWFPVPNHAFPHPTATSIL